MKRTRTAVVCVLALASCAGAAGAAAIPRITPQQQIVALLTSHTVHDHPNGRQETVISARRPITGERTVLPVLAQRIGNRGGTWLRVRLPGRAIGSPRPPQTGWIRAAGALVSTTLWHIVVDRARRHVLVYRSGRQVRSFVAIVGKPSTPTPSGEYFVEENVQLRPARPGAPFALATSARSNVLQEFDGGPGQIALHGRANLGGQLGTAQSHGCIRLADNNITWLAARISPGTPITIT